MNAATQLTDLALYAQSALPLMAVTSVDLLDVNSRMVRKFHRRRLPNLLAVLIRADESLRNGILETIQ